MQRDLVERAQRGDREAFGLLIEASMARLYNLAQMMLGDADLAADAVQDALISGWRNLRALRDPDRLDSWLTRILVRSVYRLARSERRHVASMSWAEAQPRPSSDIAGDLERRDLIDRGFRRLEPTHRAVLVVHHYLGLSDTEAAQVLGVPAGTFKSRLHRATLALRAEVEADSRAGEHLAAGTIR
jgi:RNA polymerase sigma-70 factor (ECF subfamily)